VVALGVLVTTPKPDVWRLLSLMGATASRLVIVSFQDPHYYQGQLFAHRLGEIEAHLGRCTAWRRAEGDTEITALFGP
jgi:hypothetical protein